MRFWLAPCTFFIWPVFACVEDDTDSIRRSKGIDAGAALDASVQDTGPLRIPTGEFLSALHIRGSQAADAMDSTSGDSAPPIAFDQEGNAYVGGSFRSNVSFGDNAACDLAALGGQADTDGYIAKIAPDGRCLSSIRIGSEGGVDVVRALAVGPTGKVVALGELGRGTATSAELSWSVGARSPSTTRQGAFLVQLNSALTTIDFATDLLPRSAKLDPRGLAVSRTGDIAIGGSVSSYKTTSYSFGSGSDPVRSNGYGQVAGFVARYATSGKLIYGKIWADSGKIENPSCATQLGGVAFEQDGAVLAFGSTQATVNCKYVADSARADSARDADSPDFQTKSFGVALVLMRYALDGSATMRYAAATGINSGGPRGLIVGANGDVYAAYLEGAHVKFEFGAAVIPERQNQGNATFVFRFVPSGETIQESSHLLVQNVADAQITGLAVDAIGDVVAAGSVTANTDFGEGKRVNFAGKRDLFVGKFSADLQVRRWLNAYGAEGTEKGGGIAISPSGTIAVHGSFDSASLEVYKGGSIALKLSNRDEPADAHTDGFAVFLKP